MYLHFNVAEECGLVEAGSRGGGSEVCRQLYAVGSSNHLRLFSTPSFVGDICDSDSNTSMLTKNSTCFEDGSYYSSNTATDWRIAPTTAWAVHRPDRTAEPLAQSYLAKARVCRWAPSSQRFSADLLSREEGEVLVIALICATLAPAPAAAGAIVAAAAPAEVPGTARTVDLHGRHAGSDPARERAVTCCAL